MWTVEQLTTFLGTVFLSKTARSVISSEANCRQVRPAMSRGRVHQGASLRRGQAFLLPRLAEIQQQGVQADAFGAGLAQRGHRAEPGRRYRDITHVDGCEGPGETHRLDECRERIDVDLVLISDAWAWTGGEIDGGSDRFDVANDLPRGAVPPVPQHCVTDLEWLTHRGMVHAVGSYALTKPRPAACFDPAEVAPTIAAHLTRDGQPEFRRADMPMPGLWGELIFLARPM